MLEGVPTLGNIKHRHFDKWFGVNGLDETVEQNGGLCPASIDLGG